MLDVPIKIWFPPINLWSYPRSHYSGHKQKPSFPDRKGQKLG